LGFLIGGIQMYKSRFLYDVYEEKYAIKPFGEIDDWRLGETYLYCSVGYFDNHVCRYIKLVEEDKIFHEEDLSIEFEIDDKVKIGKDKVKITEVIKNLDGSIDYKTDKKEFIPLNTYDTFFDERPKKEEIEELERPSGIVEYENFTGTEKEHNFWNRLFKK
jgi:hypothetical protein